MSRPRLPPIWLPSASFSLIVAPFPDLGLKRLIVTWVTSLQAKGVGLLCRLNGCFHQLPPRTETTATLLFRHCLKFGYFDGTAISARLAGYLHGSAGVCRKSRDSLVLNLVDLAVAQQNILLPG